MGQDFHGVETGDLRPRKGSLRRVRTVWTAWSAPALVPSSSQAGITDGQMERLDSRTTAEILAKCLHAPFYAIFQGY